MADPENHEKGGPESEGPDVPEPMGQKRGLLLLWAFVGLTLVLLTSAFAFALYRFEKRIKPPFLSQGQTKAGPTPGVKSPPVRFLRLAGSGSNLPLTRKLARAFMALHKGTTVAVHESIGSWGGIQAASDRVIHLGLSSRPFKPEERKLKLKLIPYARVAVAPAANPTVPDNSLTGAELLEIYRGKRTRWSDKSPVTVLMRERGDSSHRVFDRLLEGFASADERARGTGKWKTVYSDGAMQEALLSTAGAVGLFDVGAIRCQSLPLKVLSLNGVDPTPEKVRSGVYPFHKDLSFVSKGTPEGLARSFVRFVFSKQGKQVLEENGYIPLEGPEL